MDHNLKVSAFLKVCPDANFRYLSLQFLYVVEFSIFPCLQHSASHSIAVMNITFDSEIAQDELRRGMDGRRAERRRGIRGRLQPRVFQSTCREPGARTRASSCNTRDPRAWSLWCAHTMSSCARDHWGQWSGKSTVGRKKPTVTGAAHKELVRMLSCSAASRPSLRARKVPIASRKSSKHNPDR